MYCICVNTVPVTVCTLYQHLYTSHRVYSIPAPTCHLRRVLYTCQHYVLVTICSVPISTYIIMSGMVFCVRI